MFPQWILVVLVSLFAVTLSSNSECEPNPYGQRKHNNLHADGYIILKQGARAFKAVAGQQVTLDAKTSVLTSVISGGRVDIDHKVSIGNSTIYIRDESNVLMTGNREDELKYRVCKLAKAVRKVKCPKIPPFDPKEFSDLVVQAKQHQQIGLQGTEYRDVRIGRLGSLTLTTPGYYFFRSLKVEADAKLQVEGDGKYRIFVQNLVEFEDRSTIQRLGIAARKRSIVQIVQTSKYGFVSFGNANPKRDRLVQVDICSRASGDVGGYVSIGDRQVIRGNIFSAGDIIVGTDATILSPSEFEQPAKTAQSPQLDENKDELIEQREGQDIHVANYPFVEPDQPHPENDHRHYQDRQESRRQNGN